MIHSIAQHPYIQELLQLDERYPNRYEFHEKVKPLLLKMGADKDFLKEVIKRNFSDDGYLKQQWSGYNIPFLYVFETEHFNLKIHLFPPEEHNRKDIAAHCIHHHNNYLLTTNAFFGSGYESILFGKNPVVDPQTMDVKLTVARQFHQKDWNPSTVDSWEPHVVFIPETLSATILIWTPDKKRSTDILRHNPLLKAIKHPLRWMIHKLGMTQSFGIAEEHTYQFYPYGKGFKGIEEEIYFAPTKAEKGPHIDDYSMQMLFGFIQRCGIADKEYLKQVKQDPAVPAYYHKWIDKIIADEPIADVYHRTEINIPQKTYTKSDILSAAG